MQSQKVQRLSQRPPRMHETQMTGDKVWLLLHMFRRGLALLYHCCCELSLSALVKVKSSFVLICDAASCGWCSQC